MLRTFVFLMNCAICLTSCSVGDGGNSEPVDTTSQWSIPRSQVVDGGPGKDGIPSIDNPEFSPTSEITFMNDVGLVTAVQVGDKIKAYPHIILDYHEIVNDQIETLGETIYYAVTFCPLTGTSRVWNRKIAGSITSFGVSGLLYNSNLLPYDRETNSVWSQILGFGVSDKRRDVEANIIDSREMPWKLWKELYPASKVLNLETGYTRPYGIDPYGNYKSHNSLLFPVFETDNRFHLKERGLGVLAQERVKIYRFQYFQTSGMRKIQLFNEQFGGEKFVVVGSDEYNFLASFKRTLNGEELIFQQPLAELPVIMEDQFGTGYNIFGNAIDGPGEGNRLEPMPSFMGFWFIWTPFFKNAIAFTP